MATQTNQKATDTTEAKSTENAESKPSKTTGVLEGDLNALRDEANLGRMAGHQGDLDAYLATDEGKQFVKDAKGEDKDEKAAQESVEESTKTEAEKVKKYQETVKKA